MCANKGKFKQEVLEEKILMLCTNMILKPKYGNIKSTWLGTGVTGHLWRSQCARVQPSTAASGVKRSR
jgi:hypothetical protein